MSPGLKAKSRWQSPQHKITDTRSTVRDWFRFDNRTREIIREIWTHNNETYPLPFRRSFRGQRKLNLTFSVALFYSNSSSVSITLLSQSALILFPDFKLFLMEEITWRDKTFNVRKSHVALAYYQINVWNKFRYCVSFCCILVQAR